MVAAAVITVLAFLHILAAVAWLGSAIFFLSVIGPSVRSLTPAASLEFLTKAGPRQIRFFGGTATATIVFGLALLFAAFGTNYASWPTSIDVGLSLGLLAYLIALVVTIPTFRKADKIAHGMMANPQSGPPPSELARLLKRGNIGAVLVVVILLITAAFMVVSAFPA